MATTTTTHNRFEIKYIQLPGWVIPLAAAAAVALVALAGVVGLSILLLMSPIILFVGVAKAVRNRRKNKSAPPRPWPQRPQATRPRAPIILEGVYEVFDNNGQRAETKTVSNKR